MLTRLGGWWRLWLVLMCAWTVWAAVSAWHTWPPAPKVYLDDNGHPCLSAGHLAPGCPRVTFEPLVSRKAAVADDVVLWVCPPLALALVGLGARWVYRGFRR